MSHPEITALLPALQAGDQEALDRVMWEMYAALHQLARAQLDREYAERTLSATELVNECFLRLFTGASMPALADRRHLLAVAARAMRQVLIDGARRRSAGKRPPAHKRLSLTGIVDDLAADPDPVALDGALHALEAIDPQQARIVELRFFAGLTEAEIASVLEVSVRTVQREWRMARAWLRRELEA